MVFDEADQPALHEGAGHLRNEVSTCEPSDTSVTQPRSPDVPREWTYFIRDAEGIKIGRSIHPQSRMRDLQGGNGSKLELLLAVRCSRLSEADAHRKFQHLRTHREWFRPEQELLDFIAVLKEETKKPLRRAALKEQPIISGLTKLRRAHGFNTPVGHRCSNMAEMVPNYQMATDPVQRENLAKSIARMSGELKALTAQFH